MEKNIKLTIDADTSKARKNIEELVKKLKTINNIGSLISKQFIISLYSLTVLLVTGLMGALTMELATSVMAINGAWGWREHVKAKNGK